MRDFAGKVVLLNFWGTTCGPCKLEIPWLVEFQRQFGSKGFQVVAVSMYGQTQEVLKPYVAEHRMENLTVVVGSDNLMAPFGLVGFPTTFLIDREGKYFTRHDGLINRPMVEKELATLLSQ
jgi:cytochrome c biogenesis protein CcmG/thiol:disulfide interchange protein DsbE